MSQCMLDTDCVETFYVCLNAVCQHKSLFPFSFNDVFTLVLIFLASIITTVAGVGGGIFFFPILMGVSNFTPTNGVATSLAIVSFILTSRYVMSYKERHPKKDRPLINYKIAIVFSPSSICGTIIGVILNHMLPNWILIIFIVVSLGISFKETLNKAEKQRQREIIESNKQNNNNEEAMVTLKPLLDYSNINKPVYKESKGINDQFHDSEFISEDKKQFPPKKLGLLLINLIVLIVLLLLRGSKNVPSIIGLEYCGSGYWIILFLYFPFAGVILFLTFQIIKNDYKTKYGVIDNKLESEDEWNGKSILNSLKNGFLIGLVASILGVGGAIITGPVLINMGFDAREATYTATFIAVFTSIAGSIQYFIAGAIYLDYMIICVLIGFIGLWIGMNILLDYVKKKNKNSIILYTLSGCIIIAMMMTVIPGIKRSIDEYNTGKLFTLREYC